VLVLVLVVVLALVLGLFFGPMLAFYLTQERGNLRHLQPSP
jgi:hypothetical protein